MATNMNLKKFDANKERNIQGVLWLWYETSKL